MTLAELKKHLHIEDHSRDEELAMLLESTIEWVKDYCNDPFTDGLPGGIKIAVVKMIQMAQIDAARQSESLGDWSATYSHATNVDKLPPTIRSFLNTYRRAGTV